MARNICPPGGAAGGASLDKVNAGSSIDPRSAAAWANAFDATQRVESEWRDWVAERPREERLALLGAFAFARGRHGGQRRRGSATPFWVHPVRVAIGLAGWGEEDPVILQAALLHDVVEDTPTTVDEVKAGFGPQVASVVEQVTAPVGPEARAHYIGLGAVPLAVRRLKLADRADNLRSAEALVIRAGTRNRSWAAGYLDRSEKLIEIIAPGIADGPVAETRRCASALRRVVEPVAR